MSRTSTTRSTTDRRMTELVEKLLAQPPASPPPAEYRARTDAAPPPPRTLRELYDGRFEMIRRPAWREQLLDRPAHKRNSETDVAEMVLAMEEGKLKDMLVFEGDGRSAHCYTSGDSGVWRRSPGPEYHVLYEALGQFADAMDRTVIEPVKGLIRRQQAELRTSAAEGGTPREQEQLQAERIVTEEHLRELVQLYERLRRVGYQQTLMKRLLTKRLVATRDEGATEDKLDTAKDCVAFEDGVYCFRERRLLTGAAARAKYQTMTTGYPFEEMRTAMSGKNEEDDTGDDELPRDDMTQSTSSRRAYDRFVEMIYSSTPGVREWLMDVLGSSALAENRQMIVFHYNKEGSNGKSTMFELIRRALGDLHEACQSTMLSETKRAGSGGANEELVSMKGKRIVQLTEVCSKDKLSASAVKEITGGDQQSARGLYQKKQKFVCLAILHVLCNTIPSMNDEDGGTTRRLRCIEYGSTFVDAAELEKDKYSGKAHVYARAEKAEEFEAWKYYLMYEIMRAAEKRVAVRGGGHAAEAQLPQPPSSVMVATQRLVERESTVTTFVSRHLQRTGVYGDIVTLNEMHEEYKRMCVEDGNKPAKQRGAFKEDMQGILGQCAPKFQGERNLWRGWKIESDVVVPRY